MTSIVGYSLRGAHIWPYVSHICLVFFSSSAFLSFFLCDFLRSDWMCIHRVIANEPDQKREKNANKNTNGCVLADASPQNNRQRNESSGAENCRWNGEMTKERHIHTIHTQWHRCFGGSKSNTFCVINWFHWHFAAATRFTKQKKTTTTSIQLIKLNRLIVN